MEVFLRLAILNRSLTPLSFGNCLLLRISSELAIACVMLVMEASFDTLCDILSNSLNFFGGSLH